MHKVFCDACSCSVLHTHYIALINTKAENLSLSRCGTVGNLVKLEQAVATKLATVYMLKNQPQDVFYFIVQLLAILIHYPRTIPLPGSAT